MGTFFLVLSDLQPLWVRTHLGVLFDAETGELCKTVPQRFTLNLRRNLGQNPAHTGLWIPPDPCKAQRVPSPSGPASGKARSRCLNCVQVSRPKSSLKETAAGVGNRKEKSSYTSASLLFLKMRTLRARKGKRLTQGHEQLVSGRVGPGRT